MTSIKSQILSIALILVGLLNSFAQTHQEQLKFITMELETLSINTPGLSEKFNSEISNSGITLSNFLMALSEAHKINMNIAPELSQINITNTFNDVSVSDVLLFLCKEHQLAIDFTGNILSIKRFIVPADQLLKEVPVTYYPNTNRISIDAKGDQLHHVFKTIMDESGKNLLFTNDLQNKSLTVYIQNAPFDAAMDKLALANNLYLEHTKDNFYVFEGNIVNPQNNAANNQVVQPKARRRASNFTFEILNPEQKLLKINAQNTPIAHIIEDLGHAFELNIFTATPLDAAGTATINSKSISFDHLLNELFENQEQISQSATTASNNNAQNNNRNQDISPASNPSEVVFSYKKEGDMYFFGTEKQLSVRQIEVITLFHRSIETLSDPMVNENYNNPSSRVIDNLNSFNANGTNSYHNTNRGYNNQNNNSNNTTGNDPHQKRTILELFPSEITQGLDIKTDFELNSFYITGTSPQVNRFKSFIESIDKPVPVVLIEVWIVETNKNYTTDTGVSWGIGDSPAETRGGLFPETDLTLGAKTVNKILGNFNDFGGFNLGRVGANFFATIKFMESNGDLKIISTPKLATLSSHKASFSNGQTSYYAVTQRNIYGTNNPQTSEITNYLPIDAKLGLNIRPSVTGDGQVILDVNVIQSSFGQRIDDNAPPDITSRDFSSIIRMKDQDLAILGGIEEQMKSNSGNGVPGLSRVPILKYLVSKRKRQAKKAKLSVLIKPTIIK